MTETQYAFDVVVPAHGHLELTIKCLNTLYQYTKNPFHLIVVDDSTDLTPLYMNQFCKDHDNVTYIHSDVPYKTGNQIFNRGLESCKTPYLATVMNSMKVEPEWDIPPLQVLNADPKIGVIGLKCLFPNGLIESAGIKMVNYLPCDIGRDEPGHRRSLIHEADAVQWAFAVVRKEAVYPLEDTYHGFKGWDDIDNCFVVKKKGWKIFFCGASAGFHEPRATRGNNSMEAQKENRENGQLFYKRWGLWDEFIKAHPDGIEVHQLPATVQRRLQFQ